MPFSVLPIGRQGRFLLPNEIDMRFQLRVGNPTLFCVANQTPDSDFFMIVHGKHFDCSSSCGVSSRMCVTSSVLPMGIKPQFSLP